MTDIHENALDIVNMSHDVLDESTLTSKIDTLIIPSDKATDEVKCLTKDQILSNHIIPHYRKQFEKMEREEKYWSDDLDQFLDSLELAERESMISNILYKKYKDTTLNSVTQYLDIDISGIYQPIDSPDKTEKWMISKSLIKIYRLVLSYQAKKPKSSRASRASRQGIGITRCNQCFNYIFVRTQTQHRNMCLGALAKKDKKKLCFVCMDHLGEATFCHQKDIKQHLHDTHPGIKIAHCHLCSETTYRDLMQQHNKENHYVCQKCNEPFKYKKELQSHTKNCKSNTNRVVIFPSRKSKELPISKITI